jgi:hypothetical protein
VAEVISDINIGLAIVADGQAFAYCQYLGCCDEKDWMPSTALAAIATGFGRWRAASPAPGISGGATAPRLFWMAPPQAMEDRNGFDLHFRQENDRLIKKGIYLKIVRWETFLDAISETRLQEECNKEARNCDIFCEPLQGENRQIYGGRV